MVAPLLAILRIPISLKENIHLCPHYGMAATFNQQSGTSSASSNWPSSGSNGARAALSRSDGCASQGTNLYLGSSQSVMGNKNTEQSVFLYLEIEVRDNRNILTKNTCSQNLKVLQSYTKYATYFFLF